MPVQYNSVVRKQYRLFFRLELYSVSSVTINTRMYNEYRAGTNFVPVGLTDGRATEDKPIPLSNSHRLQDQFSSLHNDVYDAFISSQA